MNLSLLKSKNFILAIVIFIGGFIRLVDLGAVPAGFHEDEAHIGYNAYSLIKTLHDKNNVFLPLAVDQFGDFRPSGLHFLTMPSIYIFGLTEFATRLPVAIFGTLSVLACFILAREVFKNEKIALLAALFMALNPWHIIASRSTSESIVAIFFVMLGSWCLIKFVDFIITEKKRGYSRWLVWAFIFFVLSFQFYHAARYFVPFIVVSFAGWIFLQKNKTNKVKVKFFVFGSAILASLLFLFSIGSGDGRVSNISIFNNPASSIQSWEQVSEDKGMSPFIVRFFHNKVVSYGYTALVNYGAHFAPDFLFFKGGLPPRYQVPWNGNFYIVDALFIILGFVLLIAPFFYTKKTNWLLALPLMWVFFGPLPAAFTFEDIPHFQRAIMMMPGLILVSAYGSYSLMQKVINSRRLFTLSLIIIGGSFVYCVALFMHDYFIHTNTHNTRNRNEGEKELLAKVDQYKKEGKNIIMTSEGANLLIFYLFYNKFDPSEFQKMGSPRDKHMLRFDGLTYFKQDCPSYDIQSNINNIGSKVLVVDRGECLIAKGSKGIRVLDSIKRPDGTIAFKILEVSPVPIVKKTQKL